MSSKYRQASTNFAIIFCSRGESPAECSGICTCRNRPSLCLRSGTTTRSAECDFFPTACWLVWEKTEKAVEVITSATASTNPGAFIIADCSREFSWTLSLQYMDEPHREPLSYSRGRHDKIPGTADRRR